MEMREEIEEILIECGIDKKDISCPDFVKGELMESLTIADVVIAIEEKYSIEIDGEDIVPKWFTNIGTIEQLVKKYLDRV